jgi:hypothetical protein
MKPQPAIANVAASVTYNNGIVFGGTITGTYPAIMDNLGSNAPSVTLSTVARGATGVIMSITLIPVAPVPSNGNIIITLTGPGMALASSGSAALTFSSPLPSSSPAPAGTAGLSAANVLTITLTSGNFISGQSIAFTVPGFANPRNAQPQTNSVNAATTDSTGLIIGASATGTFPAISYAIVSLVPSAVFFHVLSLVTVQGVWLGSFDARCVDSIGTMSGAKQQILCTYNQNRELVLKIPAYALQPQNAGQVVTLTDLTSNVYSSSSGTLSQLTVVKDFFVSSVGNSLLDEFVDVVGSEFGSSPADVTATVVFSRLHVLSMTARAIALSGSGVECQVGDTVRFSGAGLVSSLQSGVLYIVSSKPTPTSITLQSMDRVEISNLGAVVDTSGVFMSVVSPCFVNPRAFTSTAFSCAHLPLSPQAQLVVGIALELTVHGIVKTFTFPTFTLVPAPAQPPGATTVSRVSAAQLAASPQTITVLGSNFGASATAVSVSVSMPSRCDRQFVTRPFPMVSSPARSATVTFTQQSPTSVSIAVVAAGLTSALVGVHIHMLSSMSDPEGPVVFRLCNASSLAACPSGINPTVMSTWNTASGLTSAILDGMFSASNIGLYAILRTVNNPSGELRADVNPALGTINCKASVDSELPVSNVGSPNGSATVTFSNFNANSESLKMSSAVGAGGTATITFTTSTALIANDGIVLAFPSTSSGTNFVTGISGGTSGSTP